MSAGTGIDPRDRFLRAIVEQISVDRIAEIHLFPALRSGGRESAVAVVAARADEGSHHSDLAHIDPPPDERAPRLVVYRAVYRWTRKGPDRGQWEVDITAEADAPLYAVGDVVRGVQRRAGEDGEPELITPEALRLALSDRPWATEM